MTSKAITPYKKQFSGGAKALGRVAVLFGGTSAEREVSLKSGAAVLAALQNVGVNAFGIDVGENIVQQLQAEQIDTAFIVLHGQGGEDGKIQALLEIMGIPYTGTRMAPSALAMNKLKTKQIWQCVGLPTPEYVVLTDQTVLEQALAQLGGACFVKPVHEGSSLGMSCAESNDELVSAYANAKKFLSGPDSVVLAERRIVGCEYTVALLNGVALPSIEMRTPHKFYDYDAKYLANDTQYFCPSSLSEEKETEIQRLAEQAFAAVDGRSWGRVDFMADEKGDFYLLEVNTVPGMTDHSLVPMAAKAAGLSFSELVLEILVGAQ